MKRLSDSEVNFLFEWVTNWYPTQVKPKITILFLNKKEWRRFYVELPKISPEEFKKKLDEKIRKYPEKTQEIYRQINKLPESQKKQLIKKLMPHYSEKEQNIDYWMNETLGKCFTMKELKYTAEIFGQDIPDFFKPYMSHDYVIIISNFFNEEQKKKLKTKYQRNVIIYTTIFHELIHVVEHCTGTRILKDLKETSKITLHLARKYLEGN